MHGSLLKMHDHVVYEVCCSQLHHSSVAEEELVVVVIHEIIQEVHFRLRELGAHRGIAKFAFVKEELLNDCAVVLDGHLALGRQVHKSLDLEEIVELGMIVTERLIDIRVARCQIVHLNLSDNGAHGRIVALEHGGVVVTSIAVNRHGLEVVG